MFIFSLNIVSIVSIHQSNLHSLVLLVLLMMTYLDGGAGECGIRRDGAEVVHDVPELMKEGRHVAMGQEGRLARPFRVQVGHHG